MTAPTIDDEPRWQDRVWRHFAMFGRIVHRRRPGTGEGMCMPASPFYPIDVSSDRPWSSALPHIDSPRRGIRFISTWQQQYVRDGRADPNPLPALTFLPVLLWPRRAQRAWWRLGGEWHYRRDQLRDWRGRVRDARHVLRTGEPPDRFSSYDLDDSEW